MTDFVVDASAVVKALLGKDGQANRAIALIVEADCFAPHLIDAEVGSVLRRHERMGLVSDEDARTAARWSWSAEGCGRIGRARPAARRRRDPLRGARRRVSGAHARPGRYALGRRLVGGLDGNRDSFHEMFDGWAAELAGDHPEAGPDAWARYRANLYGGDNVLFSVPESVLPTITTPLLVLRGDDIHHPRSVSELMAASVPGARLIERWKDPEHLPAAASAIAEFLAVG